MRLPRDVSGADLSKRLGRLGYKAVRQSGSHLRLRTDENGEHQITIPLHQDLRLGTLSAILSDVADHHKLSRDQLLLLLFGGSS
ncbi:MAG: type II toxin-antitoxin system HicA family toxin [Fimbriimonadaceae bacterium]|nr:type II toxin-antitoxin system HicA family toxin [Fimbriimonadaceae bacterium]